jgi:hypothetical protein
LINSVANTIIFYGDSGLGKTENAVEFAKLAYEVTRKPVALISQEVSSQKLFEPLIEVGVVKAFWLNGVANPLPALRKLSLGQWPMLTGKTIAEGGTGVGGWQWKPEVFGAYVIEGLRSISERLLADVSGKGRQIGQDVVGRFEEEGQIFAKAGQSHFGFVQDELLRLIQSFGGLNIWRVLWTGHEVIGEDSDRVVIRGPGLAGKAKTGDVQKYCSMLLHIDGYASTVTAGDQPRTEIKRRIWFVKHPDPVFKTILYPAKVTIPSANLAGLAEKYPGGYFEPTVKPGGGLKDSLADFLRLEQDLLKGTTDRAKEWKAKVDAEGGRQ